jgi:CheY-like chemotaxis protein
VNPITVLVVDDHPINLKLVCDLLEADGCTLLRANDAQQAQAILKGARPDVILMDIQMPGMDGLTLTRLLKADPATRQIPVIALTASAMKGDEEKAIEAGCDGYITKPIDTRRLSAQIGEILQRTAAARRGAPAR